MQDLYNIGVSVFTDVVVSITAKIAGCQQ